MLCIFFTVWWFNLFLTFLFSLKVSRISVVVSSLFGLIVYQKSLLFFWLLIYLGFMFHFYCQTEYFEFLFRWCFPMLHINFYASIFADSMIYERFLGLLYLNFSFTFVERISWSKSKSDFFRVLTFWIDFHLFLINIYWM